MEDVLNLSFASSLASLCEVNHSFDTGVLRICYPGRNKNRVDIPKDVMMSAIKSIYNCPIVCHYDRDSDSFGSHDVEVVKDEDGSLHMVNLTQPVGVIPESANVWFEDVTEDDGTVREYLFADALLWKRQEAYRKIKEDGVSNQSMEISVLKGKLEDGYFIVGEFEFKAFTIIGVSPCFESASLEMFSQSQFSDEMAEMMHELKELHYEINGDNKSIDDKQTDMKGGEETLDKKMELAAKYGIDVNTIDFSIEDLSDEELEAKFKEMATPEETVTPEAQFSLSSEFTTELVRALSVEKTMYSWGEETRYAYADVDTELAEVYCWDRRDWLLYGFKYAVDGDKVAVDFSSKKRMKYAIVEFDGGSQESPFAGTFAKMSEAVETASGYEQKYNEAQTQMNEMQSELDTLREFKSSAEAEKLADERNQVFARFEDLVGIDEFESLRENPADFDVEGLEEKCFAIRGKNMTTLKFSEDDKHPKLRVPKHEDKKDNEPYGGLFVEFNISK